MSEKNDIELGSQVAALCVKASADELLRTKLENEPLSTLRSEGIQIPIESEEQVAALVQASLFALRSTGTR